MLLDESSGAGHQRPVFRLFSVPAKPLDAAVVVLGRMESEKGLASLIVLTGRSGMLAFGKSKSQTPYPTPDNNRS